MKDRINLKQVGVCLALIFAGSGIEASAVIKWDGGDESSRFAAGKNWEGDAVPGKEDTLEIGGAVAVLVDCDANCNRLTLDQAAVLNIETGLLRSSMPGNTRTDFIGRGSAATVNQSGGTYDIGHRLHIGSAPGGNGIYNISEGELVVSRGGNSALDTSKGTASLELGDADASGSLNIAGGSVQTRVGAVISPNGVFHVMGTGASFIGIGSNGKCDGSWIQQAGGTLRVDIDETEAGITKILVDHVDGTGDGGAHVVFEEGALLDVRFLNGKNLGSFVVMEWEGDVTDNGLKFAPGVDPYEWSFHIDEARKRLVVQTRKQKMLGLLL
ncbi:hypothetical protein P4B35_15735 [Pontiellaceae bacterium B12227]|nr:hypothetical protein [Pontiellaceae bacterium B12227]